MPFDRKKYDKDRVKTAAYREYQRKQKYRWRMLKRKAAGLPTLAYHPTPELRKGSPSFRYSRKPKIDDDATDE